MKKNHVVAMGMAVLVMGFVVYFFSPFSGNAANSQSLEVVVKEGEFEVSVTTSGELTSQNNVEIEGPSGMRMVGIYQVKIQEIIPEGTLVEQGDFVASLDKSELTEKIKNAESEVSKAESQYTQLQLDTALTLREVRERLFNLKYVVEDRELTLQQSTYEPPATIKRAQIELIKAQREFEQAKESYQIKVEQSIAKMQEATAKLQIERNKYGHIKKVMSEFDVKAPEKGMLIYARDWSGRKLKSGSSISSWNPTVALLPDLSNMFSKTYINEVDIRKIKVGQKVAISFDAFPSKKLTGEVISVANIGEQRPNSEAKVFLTEIKVNEKDTVLRPGMTTSNTIFVETIKDAVFIPIEALQFEDSVSFVYVKSGFSVEKREVKTGISNEDEIIIEKGVSAGEVILLSEPKKVNPEIKKLAH